MFESLDPPSLPQPDDDALHAVINRADRRGRRTRVLQAGVLAAAVFVAAVVAAATSEGRDSAHHVLAGPTATTVAAGELSPSAEPTSTTAPAPQEGVVTPAIQPPASVAPLHPTTTASPTRTPTTIGPRSECVGGDDLRSTTTTDRSSYPRDVPVRITLTLTNVSNHPCYWHEGMCSGVGVYDSQGGLVWNALPEYAPANGCPSEGPTVEFAPGGSTAWTFTWDQMRCVGPPPTTTTTIGVPTTRPSSSGPGCSKGPAPAGTYTAHGQPDGTYTIKGSSPGFQSTSVPFDLH